MNNKILNILAIILFTGISVAANAQETQNSNWDKQKIRGVRYMPYPSYNGLPFLNEGWLSGQIEFSDGEISDSLALRYGAFKDELIYYNTKNTSHIVIDKASINGFTLFTKEGDREFRKQYFDGFLKGERYFEVLSKGETDLIVFRKHILSSTNPYKGEGGILMDQNYEAAYQYYFYSPENGYAIVRLNRKAFLEKFSENDQKPIRKLIRKNRIKITDEKGLIQAWKIVEKEGLKILEQPK